MRFLLVTITFLSAFNVKAFEQVSTRGDMALSTLETKLNGQIVSIDNQLNNLDTEIRNCSDSGQLFGGAGCRIIEQTDVENLTADLTEHEARIIELENKLTAAAACVAQNKLYDFTNDTCAADPNRQSCAVYIIKNCGSCSNNVSISPSLNRSIARSFIHRYGNDDHIRGILLEDTTGYEIASCNGHGTRTVYEGSNRTILGHGCFYRGDSDTNFEIITARICEKTGL